MPSSGGAGGACFIIAADHGSRGCVTCLSARLAAERARTAGDRRLRRASSSRASSARPRTSTPRTTCAPGRAPTSRRSPRAASRFEVIYASKALPLHRRLPRDERGGPLVRRGLRRRAAPGPGRGGFDARADLHARQQQVRGRAGLRARARRRPHRASTRSTRSTGSRGRPPAGPAPRHARIEPQHPRLIHTGQEDSKFGFPMRDVERALERLRGRRARACAACTPTSARRSSTWRRSSRLADVLRELGEQPLLNLGGGLGIAYTREDRPPPIEDYAEAMLAPRSRRGHGAVRAGPLAGRQRGRHAVHGRHRQARSPACAPTWRSTAGCPTTSGRCSTARATRPRSPTASAATTLCTVAGMHCESGDVLVRDGALADPRPGDVVAMPATGAYGHAMANNYNAVPRPPVCSAATATLAWSSAARPSTT